MSTPPAATPGVSLEVAPVPPACCRAESLAAPTPHLTALPARGPGAHVRLCAPAAAAVLGGAIFQQVSVAISDPRSTWELLGTSLPSVSNWVINYSILNGTLMNGERYL